MVILIFNWRDPKHPKAGGAEIVTLEHALGWINAGHEVLWFSAKFKGAVSYERYKGIHMYRQGNQATVYLKAFLFYIKERKKIDIVIDEIHGIPFFTPFYVRKPKIAFINEVAGIIWDYMYPFPLSKIAKFLEPFILQLYKNMTIWTGSESCKTDLLKIGFDGNTIHVIHHGLSLPHIPVEYRKEKKPTFIFINRLVKMKGIEDVIRAFALIKKGKKDAQLWIVGRGDDRYIQKLHELIHILDLDNNIKFFGFVNETQKIELLQRAHLLLHASVKEGWGLNVIEAASVRTPSVVYKVNGLTDSVQDGITGVIIKQNNPNELAKNSLLLLQNQTVYRKMQKNALARAKNYTWKKSINQSLALLKIITYHE